MGHVITITDQDNRKLFTKQIPPDAYPRIVEAVNKTLLEQDERLKKVTYVEEEKAFRVVFNNGNKYLFPRRHLKEQDDGSKVVNVRIVLYGFGFNAKLASGKKMEIMSDLILHHCEPNYEFYKKSRKYKEVKQQSREKGKTAGIKVKAMRLSKGITQAQLSEMTGIQRPNLSRLENAKTNPNIETLSKIAIALDTTIAEFLA